MLPRLLRSIGVLLRASLLLLIGLCGCSGAKPTVRIAFDPNWRPLILQGLEPSLTGFCIDLMAEMAQAEQMIIEALRSSEQNLLFNLEGGAYAAAFTTTTPTPDLRRLFKFSDPILQTGTSIVTRVGQPPHSIAQLKGHIIGVQAHSQAFNVLSAIPGVSFKQYSSPLDALEDLVAGHLDAVAMERLPAMTYTRNTFRGKITVLDQPLDPQPAIRLAAKRDNPFFDRLVRAIEKSPTGSLQQRWGLAL